MDAREQRKLQTRLLDWYDANRRDLPWRRRPQGPPVEAYRVWLSEIMLQQTTVAAVGSYYRDFLKRWPTVEALAAAELDDVLHAWQGLGYYARARNLHTCARRVARDLDGAFPETEQALRQLPGIGAYTAAAISAIAFELPVVPVDGNVERVMSRLKALPQSQPKLKKTVTEHVSGLAPAKRPGDFAEALMDLGATLCLPRNPQCGVCPWNGSCRAREQGAAEAYPVKAAKKAKPVRRGMAFWTVREDGAVLLRRRPDTGLLGGMMEVPSTDWREQAWSLQEARAEAPLKARWSPLPGLVKHTFTHFHLELTVLSGRVNGGAGRDLDGALWSAPESLSQHALPTVMKKVIAHAQAAVGAPKNGE